MFLKDRKKKLPGTSWLNCAGCKTAGYRKEKKKKEVCTHRAGKTAS
jgi:hypothetical protein